MKKNVQHIINVSFLVLTRLLYLVVLRLNIFTGERKKYYFCD